MARKRRPSRDSDEDLREAAGRRDLDACLRIVEQEYGTGFLGSLLRRGFSPEDADDIIQQAKEILVVRWDQFDGGNFVGWFTDLVGWRSLAVRTDRSRRRRRTAGDERLPERARPFIDPVELEETVATVREFMAGLDVVNAAILRATMDGTTEDELIAYLRQECGTDLTRRAVKNRRLRLRTLLARRLGLDHAAS